ncbi:MAG: non-heme iron oxygenase ferredoxin subunit [Bauldia sp.]
MTDDDWLMVAGVDGVIEGSVTTVTVGDREIALYHLPGDEFRASDNICTHEYARLSEGWLEDGAIECPLHAGRFDIRTGKGLCAPITNDLQVFEVKVMEGHIFIKMPSVAREGSG